MAEKYLLKLPSPAYYTADDAKKKVNVRGTVTAGSYYIFNKSSGMLNLTTKEGSPGSWVNPETVSGNSNSTPAPTNVFVSGSAKRNKVSGISLEVNCYIVNLVTNKRVEFSLPGELSDNISASFEDINIRGRTAPIRGYDNSGPRTLSYEINLHEDYCLLGLKETINFLKSLAYPSYKGHIVAPICFIRLGNVISTKAQVSSVSVSYEKPYRDGAYVKATVSLDITTVVDKPIDAFSVQDGGDYL